ncbi:MAG: glycosyltransferase [Muribaculaceae bacterium]|nr:glycosyltransferase [Muribaculaceae bacterium]
MDNKDLTVIIVTYNSSALIYDCLKSIERYNDIGSRLEIIVSDNASTDFNDLESNIAASGVECTIVRNNRNGGYGYGNNRGTERARADTLLLMNPDVRLCMPVFKHGLHEISKRGLALLGMEEYEDERMRRKHSFLPRRMNLRNLMVYRLAKCINYFSPAFFYIHGACFFVRKKILTDIGGFDENLFLYGEELDIHTRLMGKGGEIALSHNIGFVHPLHNRRFNGSENEIGLKSQLYLCDKYGWSKKMVYRDAISTLRAMQLKNIVTGRGRDAAIPARIRQLKAEMNGIV